MNDIDFGLIKRWIVSDGVIDSLPQPLLNVLQKHATLWAQTNADELQMQEDKLKTIIADAQAQLDAISKSKVVVSP